MGKADYMVLGFKGYSDAGMVVTFSIEYLLKSLGKLKRLKVLVKNFTITC